MIRVLLLTLMLVLLVPGAARAACGGAPARAVFETPEVQVHTDRRDLVACYRPTGEQRVVGHVYADDDGEEEDESIVALHGGRWLHVDHFIGGDDYDFRESALIDLRTGQKAVAVETDETRRNAVTVVAGALVSSGAEGVVARYPDGRSEVLDTAEAGVVGVSGTRLYWRTAAGSRTAVLPASAEQAAVAAPPARRIGRCRPRAGARLVLNQPPLVVTRVGATTFACRKGRTRRVGAATSVAYVSDRELAYARPGFTGVLDVSSGKRRELASTGSLTFTSSALAAADAHGIGLWTIGRSEPRRPVVGPVSDVALADGADAVFWLDAMGAPQFTPLYQETR